MPGVSVTWSRTSSANQISVVRRPVDPSSGPAQIDTITSGDASCDVSGDVSGDVSCDVSDVRSGAASAAPTARQNRLDPHVPQNPYCTTGSSSGAYQRNELDAMNENASAGAAVAAIT